METTIKDLTLRDYFAAQAMPMVIRLHDDYCDGEIPFVDEQGDCMSYEEGSFGTWFPHTKFFAQACYAVADEMIKERIKHENI